MVHFDLTIAGALVTGTGAGILSMLSWRVFRRSPVGRAVFALAVMMSAFVIYYTIVFALQADLMIAKFLKSAIYTTLVAFIGLMIDAQRQVRTETNTPGEEA